LRVLVNDMLDMARLEGGRVEFVIAPQDMKALAKDVVASLAITSQEKNIQLQYNETNALTVLADAAKLRIVLNNFVSNAIKYNRDGGSVTVSHTIQDNHLVTSIADTGLGIPEEQKAHMFEKFFRVKDKDRENVTGTGLGMYITKQYIEAMGGKLWFESTHGQGTTFYFSLPIAAA
jgi:signal transduction histidine kinase